MAHDTVERFPKLIIQTPAKVGPGTYDLSDLTRPPRLLAEFHPFLCGSKRETLGVSKNAREVPGPGTYCIREPQKHIPERVSIDFTDPRFKEKENVGPGPTDYEVKDDSKFHKIRTHPGTWRGRAGKLWLTRPPRSVIPRPTSVPDKYHTGYHVDRYGVFTKNPPFKHEPTFLYNIPREERNMTTLLYKGNFWSRMTGRPKLRPSLTPGPGEYEHETKKTASQLYDEKIRESRQKSARQLRYLDIMNRRLIRENLPAPNRYYVKGWFDKFLKNSCKCDPYALEPPPFGHTAKRFDDSERTDVPGPGTYDPQDRTKCVASIFLAPFGSYVARSEERVKEEEPGPADYHSNVGNLAYEAQKRLKYSCPRPQEFFHSETDSSEHGGYLYVPDFIQKNLVKKKAVYHAAFKSRTDRFPKDEKTSTPHPGAYEVLKAFKANRDPCVVLRKPAPFGSRSERVLPWISHNEKNSVPGTAYYNLTSNISDDVKGGVMTVNYSEDKSLKPFPSPTRYCIHPYFTSSVLKRSYNAKLGKPKIITEMLEKEKPITKVRCPCTKKNLRWFTVSPKEYHHCQTVCL